MLNRCLYLLTLNMALIMALALILGLCLIITLDCSDIHNHVRQSQNNVVLAGYGHTSYLDSLLWIAVTIKCNLFSLAKKKYQKYYPKCIHKWFHFIENNSSTIRCDKDIGLLIEGTRKQLPYIRSGYKYLAQNNNCDIIYAVINFAKLKIEISDTIHHPDITNITDAALFEPLHHLIDKVHLDSPINRIALYPDNCGDIQFRQTVATSSGDIQ